jgi:hypothetical protein
MLAGIREGLAVGLATFHFVVHSTLHVAERELRFRARLAETQPEAHGP